MCPILSTFGKSVLQLQINTAEPSQRINFLGKKFDEVDPQQAPNKNLYLECLSYDPIFADLHRRTKRNGEGASLSNLMNARQQARSRTPSRADQNSQRTDEPSYISRPRSKTPQKKLSIFDDFTGFLDGPSMDEFSQNFFGDKKSKDDLKKKETSMKEESSYLSNRKTPTRKDDYSEFDLKYRSAMNETAFTSKPQDQVYMPSPRPAFEKAEVKDQKDQKPFAKAGIPDEEFNIETQRRLLEEIERKHKSGMQNKTVDEERQAQYFRPQTGHLDLPDPSRSNLNKTVLNSTMVDNAVRPVTPQNVHNVSDVLLDPPSMLDPPSFLETDKKKEELPFSEFLDCTFLLPRQRR